MTAATLTLAAPATWINRSAFIAALAALVAGVVYWILGPTGTGGGVYVPLADAFLHGRLWIEDRPWLELVPVSAGSLEQYVPLPPAPALTLIPVVAVTGSQPWSAELAPNAAAAFIGGANVGLVYLLAQRLGARDWPLALITVGFATSTHLWVAGNGGPHHYAQLVGVLFTLLALYAAVAGRLPVLAGLAVGLAAASRLPMGLVLPLVLWLYGTRPNRSHALVLAGLALPAIAVAWYNLARFGSPFDFGYARIPFGDEGALVTDEPWFADGILSLSYIPRSLGWALFGGLSLQPPFVTPSLSGLSLLLTAPLVFLAARARGHLAVVAVVVVTLVMLPNLAHGSWGFAQWGYRFILDAMPVIIVLLAIAYRRRPAGWLLPAAVAVGAAWNLAGFAWAA